jgi:hypothetical protein
MAIVGDISHPELPGVQRDYALRGVTTALRSDTQLPARPPHASHRSHRSYMRHRVAHIMNCRQAVSGRPQPPPCLAWSLSPVSHIRYGGPEHMRCGVQSRRVAAVFGSLGASDVVLAPADFIIRRVVSGRRIRGMANGQVAATTNYLVRTRATRSTKWSWCSPPWSMGPTASRRLSSSIRPAGIG